MVSMNIELNAFCYIFKVLSKHAGLWITTAKDVFYSQAVHITFICPMRFDAFPLDTQVRKKQYSIYTSYS